jgi:hypothetical protein
MSGKDNFRRMPDNTRSPKPYQMKARGGPGNIREEGNPL